MEKTQQRDGIYDASGRYLAPASGNESLQAVPQKRCPHGTLCKACSR